MPRESHLSRGACALLWTVSFAPNSAQAFCRTTTATPSPACPAECPATGTLLAWGTPEIEYAFNSAGFASLDEASFRGAVARAFAHWAEVRCAGQPIGFQFGALPQRTNLTVGPQREEPNLNVLSELSASQWSELEYSPKAFAKTELWFDVSTGEILGADIAFNRDIGTMGICPDSGCPANTIDLENVATHEIGHFLGLAHSAERDSTMWCDAVPGDLQKRTLAADDEAGLCAIYGSRAVFIDPVTEPKPEASAGGCAVDTGSAPSAWSLLGLALLWRRRRR